MAKLAVSAAIIIVLIAIGVFVVVFNPTGNVTREAGIIKIGAILPLSGAMEKYGEGLRNSIELAIEELGMEGKVQLVIEDDHSCTIKDSVSAAQKLINIDEVDAIIGPLCSSATLSVAPIAEQSKTILISPSATSPSITDAGEYIFRTISSDKLRSEKVAEFVFNVLKKVKAALLFAIDNDSFLKQREEIREKYTSLGGKIVAEESFRTGDTDFKTQLLKIKNSGAEIVFFGAFPKEIGLFLKQAGELNINIIFISADTATEDPDIVETAGESAEGILYAYNSEPNSAEYGDFLALYKQTFGQEPPGYGAEAYDATVLAIKAVLKSDGSKEDIKNSLHQVGQNYPGASGVIIFDENGDVISKEVIIKTIKNGKFVAYGG